MGTIINYPQPGDSRGMPLPPPNWQLIDAVAATLGLLPEPRPPADGGAR